MLARGMPIGLLTTVLLLTSAPAASAATEVGTDCAADAEASLHTLVPFEKRASSRPLTVPAAGILTGWQVELAPPLTPASSQVLKVMRAAPGANSFEVVAESAPLTLAAGDNAFAARIPVRAGDRFGISGGEAGNVVFCAHRGAGESFGSLGSELQAGSSASFTPGTEVQVPVIGTVEADADGDGYGDETQDRCPQSASYRAACPRVALRVRTLRKPRSLRLLVTASMATEVTVYGQAMWGFRPKDEHRGKMNLIVPLSSGTKEVAPGEPVSFHVRYSKEVKRRLRKLTAKESVRTRITVAAPNLDGPQTKVILRPRLYGWVRGG